ELLPERGELALGVDHQLLHLRRGLLEYPAKRPRLPAAASGLHEQARFQQHRETDRMTVGEVHAGSVHYSPSSSFTSAKVPSNMTGRPSAASTRCASACTLFAILARSFSNSLSTARCLAERSVNARRKDAFSDSARSMVQARHILPVCLSRWSGHRLFASVPAFLISRMRLFRANRTSPTRMASQSSRSTVTRVSNISTVQSVRSTASRTSGASIERSSIAPLLVGGCEHGVIDCAIKQFLAWVLHVEIPVFMFGKPPIPLGILHAPIPRVGNAAEHDDGLAEYLMLLGRHNRQRVVESLAQRANLIPRRHRNIVFIGHVDMHSCIRAQHAQAHDLFAVH